MKRKGFVLISLLWLLSGCMHRPNNVDIYQRIIGNVMPFVDSGYITKKYIHIYEMSENDSSSMYNFFEGDAPISDFGELPSKIVKTGDKYFCFIELDEPELSIEQINRITNGGYYIGLYEIDISADIWFMGISKYKNSATIVKRSPDADFIYDYPELWPYFSGGQPDNPDFYMWSGGYDMVLSDPKYLESDSLKFHIKKIAGRISVRNKTNSAIVLSPDVSGKTFIVTNGVDTLHFSLRDSLPVEIPADGYEVFFYETKENSAFFQKLPSEKT